MKSVLVGLLALLSLVSASRAVALDLPDPPAGFSWQRIPEIKAAFLKPDGWYYKAEEQEGTLAFFITAENIDTEGEFQTGLSLNVKTHMNGTDAVAYAREFVSKLGQRNELIRKWETETGLLHGFGCLTRVPGDGKHPPVLMHSLAFGNSKTNTIYVFFFESPESQWEQAWKIGEKMMQLLILDDEI
jgi:hypothetical protein